MSRFGTRERRSRIYGRHIMLWQGNWPHGNKASWSHWSCHQDTWIGLWNGKEKLYSFWIKTLLKDADGSTPCATFRYSSVVVMLLYLWGHTRLYIDYAVSFCARYMFFPKHLHETALKRIGCYLKAARDWGLILDPSSNVCKLYCYPDAGFTVTDGHEIPTDPDFVNSRTGFVITFANCPIYWESNFQTENVLSTM